MSTSDTATRFWTDGSVEHQQIAKQFYEGIEYDREAYNYVTSRRMCPCLEWCNRCSFPLEGKVVRVDYRGPRIMRNP